MLKLLSNIFVLIMGFAAVFLALGVASLVYLFRKHYRAEDYRVISIQEYKDIQIKNRALAKAKHMLERDKLQLERSLLDTQRELELLAE